jgi:hypothetical protein
MSSLFRKERTATDPEFCEGFEVLPVTVGNCVFLSPFNAETILSRRVRLDLYYKRGIHERGSMDPNESVWLQLFCHHRNGLAQQIGVRFPLQRDIIALGLNCDYIARIDEKNPSFSFDCASIIAQIAQLLLTGDFAH